jgi:uncharacterized protein (DUF4415 family)
MDAMRRLLMGYVSARFDAGNAPSLQRENNPNSDPSAAQATDACWTDSSRPHLYKPTKKPVTLRLDVDVVEWFKSQTMGGGYQTEINRVLREHVAVRQLQP